MPPAIERARTLQTHPDTGRLPHLERARRGVPHRARLTPHTAPAACLTARAQCPPPGASAGLVAVRMSGCELFEKVVSVAGLDGIVFNASGPSRPVALTIDAASHVLTG